MTTKVYENSLRAERLLELLLSSPDVLRFSEIIILPIPTTRDGVTVSGCGIPLHDVVDEAHAGTLVLGYGLPEWFTDLLSTLGASFVDVARDEEFLVGNASLTALATLGVLLDNGRAALSDLKIGIVGYGRIGRALLRDLLYFGADVTVFTSRESVRVELGEMGIRSEGVTRDADIGGLDILINTAPAVSAFLDEIPDTVRIIELASGENFPSLTVEKYPSLPARKFPLSAGGEWYRSVIRALSRMGGGYAG